MTTMIVPTIDYDPARTTFVVRANFEDRHRCKAIPGRKFAGAGAWEAPSTDAAAEAIAGLFPDAHLTPPAQERIHALAAAHHQVAKMKHDGWANATPLAPMPVKDVTPFQHQVLGFNVGITIPHSALLMEMGTGKTLTTVAVIGHRARVDDVRRVLIVAPAAVVPVWPREFAEYAAFDVDVAALQGPVTKRVKRLQEFPDRGVSDTVQIVVINYEAVRLMIDELAAWKPDMIVCDESQRIKGPGTKQSKAVHKLGTVARFRMILTGTPVTQAPLDYFSQYKFLDPAILGTNFASFKARYAIEVPLGETRHMKVVGYRMVSDLCERVHRIAYRVTKDECLDLPEFVDRVVPVTLPPAAQKLYEQIARDSVAELAGGEEITATNILTKLLRLQQLTGGSITDDEGVSKLVHDAKLKAAVDLVSDVVDGGRKVVVFARFHRELDELRARLEKHGVAWIDGRVNMQERGPMVERFQTDPECRVFIAQTQTAGLGITLTAADTALFYSLDFSFANYDQARSRVHRIGQSSHVTNLHLIVPGTVDEAVLKVLDRKRNVADLVVGDRWQELFDGTVRVDDF